MESDFSQFVSDLLGTGKVNVADVDAMDDSEIAMEEVARTIVDFECIYRLEIPSRPPSLDLPAAIWAAQTTYRACQLIAFRHHDEKAMEELFAIKEPDQNSASAVYSVDLFFRFLSDIYRLASTISNEDPLVRRLDGWCQAYPLSSIGIRGVKAAVNQAIVGHPSLLRMYLDRVISRDDADRINDAAVRRQLELAVGGHDKLRKRLGNRLQASLTQEAVSKEG